jgi:hypothetical protein
MFNVYVIVSDSAAERYYIGFSTRPRERTQLARIRQLVGTSRGGSPQFLAFLQNSRHAYSSNILKVVQAGRFFGVMCLIRSWCRYDYHNSLPRNIR